MFPRFGARVTTLLLTWLAGCSGRGAQPALLLQVNLITRGQATEQIRQRRHELVFGASVAVPLDPVVTEDAQLDVPEAPPLAPDCEPGSDPLCAWAHMAEQLAWAQTLEHATTALESSR
jgi:hypothetical protein